MDRLPHSFEILKLLSMTDNVVVRERVYDAARRSGTEVREYGRLRKSIHDMAKSAANYRKVAVTPAMHFERGAAAARKKLPRDAHQMNPGAAALRDWLAGYDSIGGEP